ncbi:MAG TPA: hypothetical protein VMG10_08875 [Gemmataceae bacterium]|nr:hypothetical protein [Gemmataceae bacterium]
MIQYYSRYLDDRALSRRWLDPRLRTVRVADIQAYLLRKGWKPVVPDRPYVLVFQEPTVSEEGPLYQFVPDTEQRRDYVARIYELLAALGEIEDRYAGDVLTDILHQSSESVPANGPGMPLSIEPTPK